MEARAFEKGANLRSHIVINEKLEPCPRDGVACATPNSCLAGHRPKTRSGLRRSSGGTRSLFESYSRSDVLPGEARIASSHLIGVESFLDLAPY